MAEPRNRRRARPNMSEKQRPGSNGRRRRPRRRGNHLIGLIGLLAFLAVAAMSLGLLTSGAFGDGLDDERCASCHTTMAETATFSHKTHAAGRVCAQCHKTPKHARFAMARAGVGLADPADAKVGSGDLTAVAPSPAERPSSLEGHKAVICSSCHDMAKQSCSTCHQMPQPAHYRAACTTCHTPDQPFAKTSLTHPIFGKHTTATASCDACHDTKSEHKPSCRRCHQNRCGKGVTSMAGCLKCHQHGETELWLRASE